MIRIVSSYSSGNGGIWRAIIALVVGVVLIVSRTDATVLVVQILAAAVLAMGLISLIRGFRDKPAGGFPLLGMSGSFNILISIIMFAYPEAVAHLIVFLIGLVLFGSGLMQAFGAYGLSKMTSIGVAPFILPVIIMVVGCVLMFSPAVLGKAVGLVAGIAMILYGVSSLLTTWRLKNYRKRAPFRNVDYNDVDEQ